MIWTTKNWKAMGAKLIGKDSAYLIWDYKGIEVYSLARAVTNGSPNEKEPTHVK